MKFSAILFVGAAMCLSSCCTPPKENYQQAIQSDLVESQVSFRTLKPVDSGDTVEARRLLCFLFGWVWTARDFTV